MSRSQRVPPTDGRSAAARRLRALRKQAMALQVASVAASTAVAHADLAAASAAGRDAFAAANALIATATAAGGAVPARSAAGCVTVAEIAAAAGCHPSAVHRAAEAGHLHPIRVSPRLVLFDQADAARWIARSSWRRGAPRGTRRPGAAS